MDAPQKDLVSQIANVERAYGGKASWKREVEAKSTQLAYEHWLVARTQNFKAEFGDWEAKIGVERINSNPTLDLSGMEPVKDKSAIRSALEKLNSLPNQYDDRRVTFPQSISGKIDAHKGFDIKRIVSALDLIYQRSAPMYSLVEEDRVGHKVHISNIQGYHNYLGKFRQDGNEFYVRFTIQELKGKAPAKGESQLHSTFVSSISIYEHSAKPPSSAWGQDPLVITESSAGVTRYDAKLAAWLAAGKQKIAPNGKVLEAREPTSDEVNLFLEHQRFRIPLGHVTLPLSSESEKLIRIANTARKLRKHPNDLPEKRIAFQALEQSLNSVTPPGLTAIPLKRLARVFSMGNCSEKKLRDACLEHENAIARNLGLRRGASLENELERGIDL